MTDEESSLYHRVAELEAENAALRALVDAQANYQRDLRADRDRLDWLTESPDKRLNAVHDLWCNDGDIGSIRAAIDAARKEQP